MALQVLMLILLQLSPKANKSKQSAGKKCVILAPRLPKEDYESFICLMWMKDKQPHPAVCQ